jgi:hypothetical protein
MSSYTQRKTDAGFYNKTQFVSSIQDDLLTKQKVLNSSNKLPADSVDLSAVQTQLDAKLPLTGLASRIDTLGFSGTTSSGNNWSVRIPGGRSGANDWNGAKVSNQFSGNLALSLTILTKYI